MTDLRSNIISGVVGGIIVTAISFGSGAVWKSCGRAIDTADAAKVATELVDDKTLRNALLQRMSEDPKFRGPKGDTGKGTAGPVGPQGPDVPLGTILAWHKRASVSGKAAELPKRWRECNGQQIQVEKGGPLDPDGNGILGLPDLNQAQSDGELADYKGGAFLRGGRVSGTFQHATTVASAYAHPDKGQNTIYAAKVEGQRPQNIDRVYNVGHANQNSIDNVTPTGGSVPVGLYGTRPVNFSVVWIMRVE